MLPSSLSLRWGRRLDGTFVRLPDFLRYCYVLTGIGYTMSITAPTEITAAATLIEFWQVDVNMAVWITVFGVFIVAVNFCDVRVYGEVSSQTRPSSFVPCLV